MPWKVVPVSDIRLAFVHQVRSLGQPVTATCRKFGISRKTGYKWLKRFAENSTAELIDRSRRPQHSPTRTPQAVEDRILAVRDRYGWGPRKIRAHLKALISDFPSVRTCAAILKRCGRLKIPEPAAPLQFFERGAPNELWQCDFKGPLEVQRRRVAPFTILDDHSRFLLRLRACLNQTMAAAWEVLWDAFGEYGLPDAILCDNAFRGSTNVALATVSWFDSRLLRLDIKPLHGRPYHPQTQGKVERFHGTLERELWPKVRRDTVPHFDSDCEQWRYSTYNLVRPHEALADTPPIYRYQPSPRKRPAVLPELSYPVGSIIRKVGMVGDVRWRTYRLLVGRGLVGDTVRLEETNSEVVVYYAKAAVRRIPFCALLPDTLL
jgi:transposase InsO family protein